MSAVIEALIDRLGEPVRESQGEYVFMCPFCVDRIGKVDTKGHMYVNEEKGFFCHRCDAKGKVAWLLKQLKIEQLDLQGEVPELTQLRMRIMEPDGNVRSPQEQNVHVPVEVSLPENTMNVWDNYKILRYAMSRGLSLYDCAKYRLLGVIDKRGNERLLFTDYLDGKLVFWQARAIDDSVMPKYLTVEGVEKSHCVWNLSNVDNSRIIYIAEGIMSARACGRNGVAIYGKSLSYVQQKMIEGKVGSSGVGVVLDGSALSEAYRIAVKFIKSKIPVSIIKLPGKSDPDELRKEDSNLLDRLLLDTHPMSDIDILRLRAGSV